MNTKMKFYESIVGQPIPGNTPVRVADSEKSPYFYVGLLQMKFPNGKSYYGTGTLILKNKDDKESKYVLTCAHNLYDKNDGGKATSVDFTRGYNDPKEPYKKIKAKDWKYPTGYPEVAISRHADLKALNESDLDAEIKLDYALVILDKAEKVDTFPELVVKNDKELLDHKVQLNGYGYLGKAMSHATGKIKYVDNDWLTYPISTKRGASGTAIMDADSLSVFGVHTRRYDKGIEKLNRGIRLTKEVVEQIRKWMK